MPPAPPTPIREALLLLAGN